MTSLRGRLVIKWEQLLVPHSKTFQKIYLIELFQRISRPTWESTRWVTSPEKEEVLVEKELSHQQPEEIDPLHLLTKKTPSTLVHLVICPRKYRTIWVHLTPQVRTKCLCWKCKSLSVMRVLTCIKDWETASTEVTSTKLTTTLLLSKKAITSHNLTWRMKFQMGQRQVPLLACSVINSKGRELKMHLNQEEEVQPSMLLTDRDLPLATEQQAMEVVEMYPSLKFKLASWEETLQRLKMTMTSWSAPCVKWLMTTLDSLSWEMKLSREWKVRSQTTEHWSKKSMSCNMTTVFLEKRSKCLTESSIRMQVQAPEWRNSKMKTTDWTELSLIKKDSLRCRLLTRRTSGRISMVTRSHKLISLSMRSKCWIKIRFNWESSLTKEEAAALQVPVDKSLQKPPRDWRRESLNAKHFGIHSRTWSSPEPTPSMYLM